MARARNIPQDTALDAAVAAFWQHGFGAMGTRKLEAETGITRFTLQKSYGGKLALFCLALDAYLDQMEETLLPQMNDGTLEGLASWFEQRSAPSGLPPQAHHGCMMIAAMNEFGATEPEVSSRSARFQAMLRSSFEATLTRIKEAGGISDDVKVPAAVEILMAATIGMNVVVRGAGSCDAAAPVGEGIAQMVRSWARPPN